MGNWISISSLEEIPAYDEILVWDGCDYHIDYIDVCAETGTYFMANKTEPTHYMILTDPETNHD